MGGAHKLFDSFCFLLVCYFVAVLCCPPPRSGRGWRGLLLPETLAEGEQDGPGPFLQYAMLCTSVVASRLTPMQVLGGTGAVRRLDAELPPLRETFHPTTGY